MADITVSVFMLTYNQEDFIGQAIEGVLMQKTDFTYQLVIGEDCSTDSTRKICSYFARKHPNKINLLPSHQNQGLINNFIRTYKECSGKYVAICDGDDYWINPHKLQKQVDFLEKNPEYGLTFTSFKFLFTDGKIIEKDYSQQKRTTDFRDLVMGNFICSATALFRNKSYPEDFPDWLRECPYGDWPLYLWTVRNGSKIKFLSDITAIYRKEIGVSEKMKTTPSRIASENFRILQNVRKDRNFKYFQSDIKKSIYNHSIELLACYSRDKKYMNAFKLGFELTKSTPLKIIKMYFYLLKRNLKDFTVSGKAFLV